MVFAAASEECDMACGNTMDPSDVRLSAESLRPLGHPAHAVDSTSSRSRDLATVPLVLGERALCQVNQRDAIALGIERACIEQFNLRAAMWKPETQRDMLRLAKMKPLLQAGLIEGVGNSALNSAMASAIPGALLKVIESHSELPGLFSKLGKDRGPYQTTWLSDLSNRGRGISNGIAFELLLTARLHDVHMDGLYISPTDKISFGQKAQGKYGSWGSQKSSTEADLLIWRDAKEIAIDFKYRSGGDARISHKDIDAVKVALQTGEWDEFHYVCNSEFDHFTKEYVDEVNRELAEDGKHPIILNEHLDWR
jgi:hypothetical protein